MHAGEGVQSRAQIPKSCGHACIHAMQSCHPVHAKTCQTHLQLLTKRVFFHFFFEEDMHA